MVSTLSAATLGLAALTSALLAPSSNAQTNEFILYLDAAGYPSITLNAVESGTLGNLDLVFERPSAYPGTPAYLNNTLLEFDYKGSEPGPVHPGIYSANFQDVGDNYGAKVPVTAIYGTNEATEGFGQGPDGTLTATKTAALQSFYACNTTTKGEPILGLFWGVPKEDGSAPDECVLARLVQVFPDSA
jgi:hypothetical protein